MVIIFIYKKKKINKIINNTKETNDDYMQGSDFAQIIYDNNNCKYNNNQKDNKTQPLMPVNESNYNNSSQIMDTPTPY